MDFNYRIAIRVIVLLSAYVALVEPSNKCHCSNWVTSLDINQVKSYSIIHETHTCKNHGLRIQLKGNTEVCFYHRKFAGKWLQVCGNRKRKNQDQLRKCLANILRKGVYTIL